MLLYKKFCDEKYDKNNVIKEFKLKYDDNYNFGYDVVDELAKLVPDEKAVVWCNSNDEERIFTYKDISELSNKAANAFKSYGISKGDKVIVILKRNYEYWYVAPALHKLGAILIPATNLLTVDDLTYRINLADIKAAVCTSDGNILSNMIEAEKQCPKLKTIFTTKKDVIKTINLTKEIEKASNKLERVDTKALEPMIMYFTSGTTGYPKAVMHDHTYTLSHIITARHWQNVIDGGLHFTVAETGWGKASWGKIYGQWLCGSSVMVYDYNRFLPGKLMEVIEKYKVTTFCAPPTVYRYLIKKGMTKYDLSSLKHISTAGEALNPEVFKKVYEQCGLKIMEAFGQTESVLMLGNFTNTTPKPGAMGKPSPLYNVKIIINNNQYAKPNEIGEIVVVPPEDGSHQHGIFMGYCNNDDLYEKVWHGGVYHTGDTAYMDEDGYYWYVGRVDDIIKTRGYRVGPFEIENILMEHPAVLECAIVGIPDKNRGQAIKAVIMLTDKYTASKELAIEIKEFVNNKMASYKWIQEVEFVKDMPKTISGKIRRVELRS